MKASFLLIFVLLAFTKLYAQEMYPEFEKTDETKYKIGIGGMLYSNYYGLNVNSRYKFKNKRELGLTIGGFLSNYNSFLMEHHMLLYYLPLKKKERIVGVDLVLSLGVYRRYYKTYKFEALAVHALMGFDLYYNINPYFNVSFTMNIGPLFSSKPLFVGYNNQSQPFFNFNTFYGFMFIELKYKIKGRKK